MYSLIPINAYKKQNNCYHESIKFNCRNVIISFDYASSIINIPKEKAKKQLSKKYKRKIIELYDEGLLEGNNKTNAFLIKYFEYIYKPMYKIYNKIRKPNWDI